MYPDPLNRASTGLNFGGISSEYEISPGPDSVRNRNFVLMVWRACLVNNAMGARPKDTHQSTFPTRACACAKHPRARLASQPASR